MSWLRKVNWGQALLAGLTIGLLIIVVGLALTT